MTEKLKEKILEDLAEADWDMLRVHNERGMVFIVSASLELGDIAVAMSLDKTQLVKNWLDNGDLFRPKEEQVSEFEKEKFKKIGKFLIIQPYIIVQLAQV